MDGGPNWSPVSTAPGMPAVSWVYPAALTVVRPEAEPRREYGGAGCLVRADRLAGEPTRTSAYPSAFTSPTLIDWPNMSPFSAVPGTPAVSWW